jgi:hypothetical protein
VNLLEIEPVRREWEIELGKRVLEIDVVRRVRGNVEFVVKNYLKKLVWDNSTFYEKKREEGVY